MYEVMAAPLVGVNFGAVLMSRYGLWKGSSRHD